MLLLRSKYVNGYHWEKVYKLFLFTPTLMNITSVLKKPKTINQVAEELGLERHTVAKKLEALEARGVVKKKLFGRSKIYSLSENPLVEALKQEDEFSKELKSFLSNVTERVSLHDQEHNILFSNKENKGKCYEVFAKRESVCPECPANEVMKTGESKDKKVSGLGDVKLHPVKDRKGETIGVVEVVNNG